MNERHLKRLFPNASRSFIETNTSQNEPDCDNIQVMILDVEALYSSYLKTESVHRTGAEFGISGDTVHQHLLKAGKKLNHGNWTTEEVDILRSAYSDPNGVNLALIAKQLGRPYSGISGKASSLGITVSRGKQIRRKETLQKLKAAKKDVWKNKPHPRGMAGKHHSDESKAAISLGSCGRKVPPEQTMRAMKTKVARYGSLSVNAGRGSWKAAWREIGGRRIYARSRWEANYARYLQWLKDRGEIKEWEHEPETFWFEKIRRGCRSYLPDFRVTMMDDSIEYHETKGWMDARSVTKIKRMAKYHPKVVLVIRGAEWFKCNRRKLSGIIPEWEA